MMKRTTLLDKRYPTTKFSYYGPDANTFRQVIDSHLEALDEIERLTDELDKVGCTLCPHGNDFDHREDRK